VSNANRVSLAYVEETTWGTTPSGPPTLKTLRYKSESLGQDTRTLTSDEIRADRRVSYIPRIDVGVTGKIDGELSYNAYDDFLEWALFASSWATENEVTGTIYSMASGDNSLNRSSGDFTAGAGTTFTAGQWIRTVGFSNSANNGFFKIVSVAATKIVLSQGTVTTEAAGATVTVTQGPYIVDGTTESSFTLERTYEDLSSIRAVYNGLEIDQLDLSGEVEGIWNVGFGLFGKREVSGTSTIGTGSNTAAPTKLVMNAVDDINGFLEGGSAVTLIGSSFSLKNNLRQRKEMATLGPTSMGLGTCEITGTFRNYFSTAALFTKYLAYTTTSHVLKFVDSAGNGLLIEFPNIKITAGRRVAGAKNTDVIGEFSFAAFSGTSDTAQIRIAKFDV